jgi:hypothetical protein
MPGRRANKLRRILKHQERVMNHKLIGGLAALTALALSACATNRDDATDSRAANDAAASGEATPMMAKNDAELQTYRIRDWSAPNDKTLLVKSLDGSTYRAEFMGPCTGLRFSNTIGFVTRGMNELDKYAGIVLSDGTRCTFRTFQKLAFEPPRNAEAGKEAEGEQR